MRSFRLFLGVLAAAAITLALGGCMANPVKSAETFEQQAFALYGTYVIFQGKATELATDSLTPVQVKKTLQVADALAYPLAEQLVDAAVEVGHIRDILTACNEGGAAVEATTSCQTTSEQVLENAITHLSEIYFLAQPKLLGLVAAVKGANRP